MPKLTYKHDWSKIKENALSEHQIDTGMGSVKDAVKKVFSESKMEDPYKKYEEMEKAKVPETKLHASRGSQLQGQKINILEIDVGGSGYKQPQNNHAGLGGKNDIREGKGKATLSEIENHEKWNVHWWNRVKWFQKLPKSIRPYSEEEIKKHNEIVDKYGNLVLKNQGGKAGLQLKSEELFEKKYGKNATAEGLAGKKYIYVKENEPQVLPNGDKVYRTRYNMPGPLGTVMGMGAGVRNSGDYSIKNLSGYMLAAGKDYLTKIFTEWQQLEGEAKSTFNGDLDPNMGMQERLEKVDALRSRIKPVTIMLKGHSRGGVAVSHGAMQIKDWIHREYPQYEKYVNFETIQMDPVAGYGSDHGGKRNINLVEETRPEIKKELDKKKMMPLGPSANTTVVYSLHTDHSHFFSPQIVDGAKRVILTAAKHSVNLETIDESQKGHMDNKAHRKGYMDLTSGEMYRNSGLSELPEGVYIADENHRLVKIPNLEVGRKIIKEVLKDVSGQEGRHDRIDEVMDNWFAAHSKDKTREKTSVKELEANEKKEDLGRKTYSASEKHISKDSLMQQEPERKRSASISK